jgi:hypothetical protein
MNPFDGTRTFAWMVQRLIGLCRAMAYTAAYFIVFLSGHDQSENIIFFAAASSSQDPIKIEYRHLSHEIRCLIGSLSF